MVFVRCIVGSRGFSRDFAFGREAEALKDSEPGFVVGLHFPFRGKLDHSEDRASGRRHDADLFICRVFSLGKIGRIGIRHPKERVRDAQFFSPVNGGGHGVDHRDCLAGCIFSGNDTTNGRSHGHPLKRPSSTGTLACAVLLAAQADYPTQR